MNVSIIAMILVSFTLAVVIFILFLIAFFRYSRTFSQAAPDDNRPLQAVMREKASEAQNTDLISQQTQWQQRLQTIRESEELIQIQQRQMEIDNRKLVEAQEQLNHQRQCIENRERALEDARIVLQKQKEEIDRMNTHKNEFMTNMSHELKTPLNSILTLTQVLIKNKEDNLSDKQLQFLRTVHSSGKTLLSLINDVLDVAKIESGKTETFIEPIEINAIKKEISETFYAEQLTRNISFDIEIEDHVPEIIYSDKKRLLQILRNILANAFKFTEKGYVKFKILNHDPFPSSSTAMLSPENYLVFSIEDTGLGIAADKQEVIFEEFVQADGSTTRNYGGTGLGLAISQKLTKLLGGEIKLKSELGKGSTFNVYLPISRKETSPQADHVNAALSLEQSVGDPSQPQSFAYDEDSLKRIMKGKRIVMITNNMKYLFLLTSFMEQFKAVVNGTTNPAEGVGKLYNHPDATFVILDEYMARENQYQTLSEISSHEQSKNIPLVILPQSDRSGKALKEEFSDYNIACIFPKAFEKNTIIKELSTLI